MNERKYAMSLLHELVSLAHKGGGSFKTRSDRENFAGRFADKLKNIMNIQIRTVDQLKTKHIEEYVQCRLNEKISRRSMQNEMAALRKILAEAGRAEFAKSERLTNKSLGLAGASRDGTKTAITTEKYQDALSKAQERDDSDGMVACLQLSRELGLRSEEAVQANKSLKTWEKNLLKGKDTLKVVFGTKGDKPRNVTLHENRKNIMEAVAFAIAVAKRQGGRLIDKPSLEQAMDRFHNEAVAIGLVGEFAPHSLRYAFARDQIYRYEAQGYSHKEALALTSCDLGHGDGRGRYIEQVYSK